MAKILCVEDSKEFQIYLTALLREHNLVYSSSIGEAMRLVETNHDSFDLVLLDISLPDGNGMRALPVLKEKLSDKMVPIIVISSDSDVLTKVAAFGVGADDYISKPPDPSELKARINARLRAAMSHPAQKTQLSYGDLRMNLDQMSLEVLLRSGQPVRVELTPYEFKILRMLMARPGQVFSREQLVERIWGLGRYITFRTVDAHISHLRRKLSKSRTRIETVLTAGYKISLKEGSDSNLGNADESRPEPLGSAP
jgi:DNA-binding response OmpR family regulator